MSTEDPLVKFADMEMAKLESFVHGLIDAEAWEALEVLENRVCDIVAALRAAFHDCTNHGGVYTADSLLKLLRAARVSEVSAVGLEMMGLAASPNRAEYSTGGIVHRRIGDILLGIRCSVESELGARRRLQMEAEDLVHEI